MGGAEPHCQCSALFTKQKWKILLEQFLVRSSTSLTQRIAPQANSHPRAAKAMQISQVCEAGLLAQLRGRKAGCLPEGRFLPGGPTTHPPPPPPPPAPGVSVREPGPVAQVTADPMSTRCQGEEKWRWKLLLTRDTSYIVILGFLLTWLGY
jgi:hypothetical protein